MKWVRKHILLVIVGSMLFFVSCVSLQDKSITSDELSSMENLGSVYTSFTSFQPLHMTLFEKSMKNRAYKELLAEAKKQYQGKVDTNLIDIRNVKLYGEFSGMELLLVIVPPLAATANFQKIVARGDVVIDSLAARGRVTAATKGIQGAIYRAAQRFVDTLPDRANVAVLSVSTDEDARFIIDELEFRLEELGAGFHLVTRGAELDQIRREQNFQISGDVSDDSAVSIGHMLGATIVITGSTSRSGNINYLTLRAIDVTTARVITTARETY